MPLRIGINALYLLPGGVGGTEIYLRELLQALSELPTAHEFVVFSNREAGLDLTPGSPRFFTDVQPVEAVNRPARILWEQTGLIRALRRQRISVLLNAGFTAPVAAFCPQVTVFHDLQHKRHPEHFRWFDLPPWRFLLWAAAHRSQRLIAVSGATRQDLLRYYQLPPSRIDVVPHGVNPRFFALQRAERDGSGPHLLCVSTLHPHKNLERLLEAFALLRRSLPTARLTLAGMRGFHSEAVESKLRSLGLQEAVRVTGWIPRPELESLFTQADLFVYPSTFEGFGMPVLESLAAGLPTACSAIPPLREVAGDAAAYFPPDDVPAMADTLQRLLTDAAWREQLHKAGPARAAQFTWSACAQTTLHSLEQAAR